VLKIDTNDHGRSNANKDKEEGGYEFNDEGLNAVWLSGLSGASKCDSGHGYSAQLLASHILPIYMQINNYLSQLRNPIVD